jgi:hypothetical protein
MSSAGATPRAAVATTNARAAASRRNGAKSRGPKTPGGKARSAKNALKHGLRAEQQVVLPQEDGAEFAALEAALIAELAPEGALQTVLARRVAVATWRLARADRLEVEVIEVRSYGGAGPGLALMRDGNGTRSIETLMRYRASAMAELTRSLRTLKALQAEARALAAADLPATPPARHLVAGPNEPENLAGSAPRRAAPQSNRSLTRRIGTAPSPSPLMAVAKTRPTRETAADQRLDPRASSRPPQGAPRRDLRDLDPAALASPLATTKLT